MTDYPPGEFSATIVGPYWPAPTSVIAALDAARNRGEIAAAFDDHGGVLDVTKNFTLGSAQGNTADAVDSLFSEGSKQAAKTAEKNGIKSVAFGDTAHDLNALRSTLTGIAARAKIAIDGIKDSDLALKVKVDKMITAIMAYQGEAADASTQYVNTVLEHARNVLAAEGDPRSIEQFATDNGINLKPPPLSTAESLRSEVESTLRKSAETPLGTAGKTGDSPPPMETAPGGSGLSTAQPLGAQEAAPRPPGLAPSPGPGGPPEPLSTGSRNAAVEHQLIPGLNELPTPDLPAAPASPTADTLPIPNATGMPSMPGTPSVPSAPSMPSMPGLPHDVGAGGIPGLGAPPPGLRPEALAEGFNTGFQTGAPMSATTEALGNTISQGTQNLAHPVTYQPEFSTPTGTLSASTAPSSGGYIEAAPAAAVAPVAAAAPPMASTAPIAAAASSATAAPMAPAGPLPAYGSDLRPATATVSAAPPVPMAAAPASAAVSPSNAPAGGIAQPAVVNKAPAAPAPSASSPLGLTESASAAAASGAAAGAISAHNAGQERLRRLLGSVAHQQPRLRWAIADLEDGSTVLVTDLASGWIPPGVEIPTGVHVLPPGKRRGDLEALLREAVLIETWTPGQHLTGPDDEPVAMSLRARDLPAVDDLNWEITQATNWRDGLPRLAHTLTKASIAGTGILEAEADILTEHLRTVARQVLDAYPDRVDSDAIGNWQLLAAIDALVNGHKTALNYHFAWFQALHMARQGG